MSRRQLFLFPLLIASVLLLMAFALVTDASAASGNHDSVTLAASVPWVL